MTICETTNYSSCDEASETQISDCPTFDSEGSQDTTFPRQGGLRPAGSSPSFVPFASWNPDRSYKDGPYLSYDVDWKLFVKNRERAGQSELAIALSPRELWKRILQPKLAEESSNKPWTEGAALFILSVNDRKTKSIRKRYRSPAKIDWAFVTKTLQGWGKSFGHGKTLTLEAKFYYEVRAGEPKTAGKGATVRQRAELGAIVSEEIAYMGRPAAIRTAYAMMRCTGPPCTKGTHCWQNQGKHHRLLPHHMRMLAEHLQAGNTLNGHDDVPENFRQQILDEEREREERERKEREKDRDRQRRVTDETLFAVPYHPVAHGVASNNPTTPKMVYPTTPLVRLDMSSEAAVTAYSVWQRSQVSTDDQKAYYSLAEEVTIANGCTLDLIASNQDCMRRFYEKHGIPMGIAWNYVCNVYTFAQKHQDA